MCEEAFWFPTFLEWPSYKLDFMNNMSCVQRKNETTSVVVITSEVEEMNQTSTCKLCNHSLPMAYSTEHESWVYLGCRQHLDLFLHYPDCYDLALRNATIP